MTRNLKVLGLALVAVLAMAAMAASSASAANFTAEKYPVTLTGNQKTSHVFEAGGGKVTCTTATFHGTGSEAKETQTITPTYTGCTAFGFIDTKITGFGHYGEANKCDYLFHTSGLVDLNCAGGAQVVVDTPCPVTIEPQTGISKVEYKNEKEGTKEADVLVTANATNIKYTIDTHNFTCTLAGIGPYNTTLSNGKYTGQTTIIGEEDSGAGRIGVDVK